MSFSSSTPSVGYSCLGVMSGTSLDGLDICHVNFRYTNDEDRDAWEKPSSPQQHSNSAEKWKFELKETSTVPYPKEWRQLLCDAPSMAGLQLMKLHVSYAHYVAEVIKAFINDHQLAPQFVASHGHTIFHEPHANFTCQIGDGETMATILELPVITNFRNKDVALGGQGAPVVPGGEKFLFPDFDFCLNLGGIVNVSIGAQQGFDICACNQVLNYLVAKIDKELEYDDEGKLARDGSHIETLSQELNQLEFYSVTPPKSLGREWVESDVIPILEKFSQHPPEDLLCTYVEHVAFQISKCLKRDSKGCSKMLVTGGGAMNKYLMERISFHVNPRGIAVETGDRSIAEYKEALVFAFLGLRCILGQHNVYRCVTGARMDSVSGSLHLPPQGGYRLEKNDYAQ